MRKRLICRIPLLTLLSFALCLPVFLFAEPASDATHVMDGAGIFTDREVLDLTASSRQVYKRRGTHVAILTTESIGGVSPEEYLETYYDEQVAPYAFDATALLLIHMDPYNRLIYIQGYEGAEYPLNGAAIDAILDKMEPDMKNGNYFDVAKNFIQLVDKRFAPPFYLQTWFSLLLAFAIAGIAVFCMAYRSGGKMTVNGETYLDAGHSKLLARHDRYIRTTLSKRRKPQNNSNGSQNLGGGGVSKGGHSHSGGGRRF